MKMRSGLVLKPKVFDKTIRKPATLKGVGFIFYRFKDGGLGVRLSTKDGMFFVLIFG